MMEHSEVIAGPSIPTGSLKRVLSEEVRASLEAVRVAQENARRRARRQTLEARIWFAALFGVAVLGTLVGPRLARHGRARAAASAQPSPMAGRPPAPTAPISDRGIANAVVLSASTPAPPQAPATEGTRVAARARGDDLLATNEGCDGASIRRAPWRLSPEACTRAFEANPSKASLALAVAHAEHARGRFAEAAQWAKRALALDPKTAEAYVIIARAEAESGHHEQARSAYRRYLQLAPRGWHHDEARAALQGASS